MPKIYQNQVTRPVPEVDLLTLLFDSEHTASQEDSLLHVDATDPTNRLTKADLRKVSEQFAHGLRSRYNIGASGPYKDVVTVMTSGQVLAPAILFGVIAAGGVFSAASPSFTPPELARQITQGLSNWLICSPDLKDVSVQAAKAAKLPQSRVLILQSSPTWSLKSIDGGEDCYSSQRLTWRRITDRRELEESLIILLWSSGTTGLPKGVKLSHYNFSAEIYIPSAQAREWAAAEAAAGRPRSAESRTLAHLPVAHIAGVLSYLVGNIYTGTTVYWMRKFEWKQFLEYNRKYRITNFYTVPSIFLRISKSPDVKDHFKTLEGATTGSAPMDSELELAANARLGVGDTYINQTWGLSETTGAVTHMPAGEFDVTGSISRVLPNMQLRLVDDDGNDANPGELLVKGPVVTNGYYNNPKATQDAFRDGWFCTGDIAIDRNGMLYIIDRKKELLKYKGLQIAPAELENLLFTHPKIREAAVVGIPDVSEGGAGIGNEVPRAYVVADSSQVTELEIQEFVRARVASYKQLRGGVRFVDELPKNAIGKFLRRELRDRAKAEMQSQGLLKAKL